MKKIALYSQRWHPSIGGMETHISNLVNHCVNFEFEILTNGVSGHPETERVNERTTVRRFPPDDKSFIPTSGKSLHKLSFPFRYLSDRSRYKNFQKYIDKGKFDVLHAHHPSIPHTFAKLSKITSRPASIKKLVFKSERPQLLTIHGLLSKMNPEPAYGKYEDFIIKSYNNIICVDKNIYHHVYTFPASKGKNIWYIPNSIDTGQFSQAPFAHGQKLKVGFIGRLEKSRGLGHIESLATKLPDFAELHIVGSGNPDIIDRFKKKIDNSQIKFYSNVPNEKLPSFVHGMDVLFNPVIAEGISRITLEAMACGRPAIMLDKGDRAPIINGKTGYLVKPDIVEIVSLLKQIHGNKNELATIGKNARAVVEKEFSNEVIIPRIEAVYRKLLEEN